MSVRSALVAGWVTLLAGCAVRSGFGERTADADRVGDFALQPGDGFLPADLATGDVAGDTGAGDARAGDIRRGDLAGGDIATGDANNPGWFFTIHGPDVLAVGQCAAYILYREAAAPPPAPPALTFDISASGTGRVHQSGTCGDPSPMQLTFADGEFLMVVYVTASVVETVTLQMIDPGGQVLNTTVNVAVVPATLSVGPTYATAANWNQYVWNEMPAADVHHQPGTACTGSETGAMPVCLHGGEMRRVATTASSCATAELHDVKGWLGWVCFEEPTATFYSTGLIDGTVLSDLLDPPNWTANQVILFINETPVAASFPAMWWTNTITPLPALSPTMIVPLLAPDIYVSTGADAGCGYSLLIDSAALVIFDAELERGGGLAQCGNDTYFVESGNASFQWLEGQFDANGFTESALLLSNTSHSVVRGASALDANKQGILVVGATHNRIELVDLSNLGSGIDLVTGSDGNWLTHIVAEGNTGDGVYIFNSSNNLLDTVASAQNTGHGVHLTTAADNRLWNVTAVANGGQGMLLNGSDRTQVVYGRFTNNATRGILVDTSHDTTVIGVHVSHNTNGGIGAPSSDRVTLSQITAIANLNSGISLDGTSGTIVQVIAADNDTGIRLNLATGTAMRNVVAADNGIGIDVAGGNSNTLDGFALFGGNGTRCVVTGTNPDIADMTCAGAGQTISTVDLSMTFSGRIMFPDEHNSSDVSGAAPLAQIGDWTDFDNDHRTWAPEAPGFPGLPRGPCNGPCRIWDWRIRATDVILLNRSGDGMNDNGALFPNCPPAAELATSDAQMPTPNAFLINAVELPVFGAGDGDGLCEQDERCSFSGNPGAYQGEDVISATCSHSGAGVTGVTMQLWDFNGAF